MGGGVASAIARSLGAGNEKAARSLTVHAIVIGTVFGLVFTLCILAAGPAIYRLLGGRESVLQHALGYSDIIFSRRGIGLAGQHPGQHPARFRQHGRAGCRAGLRNAAAHSAFRVPGPRRRAVSRHRHRRGRGRLSREFRFRVGCDARLPHASREPPQADDGRPAAQRAHVLGNPAGRGDIVAQLDAHRADGRAADRDWSERSGLRRLPVTASACGSN